MAPMNLMAESDGSSESDNETSSVADDASIGELLADARHLVASVAEDKTWMALNDRTSSTPQMVSDVSDECEKPNLTNDEYAPNYVLDLLDAIRDDSAEEEEVGTFSSGDNDETAAFSSYAATQTMTPDEVVPRASAAAMFAGGQENADEDASRSGAGAIHPELQQFLLQQQNMLPSPQPANIQQQQASLEFPQRQQQTQQQAVEQQLQALQLLGAQHGVRPISQAQAQASQQSQAICLPDQFQILPNQSSALQAALVTSQQEQRQVHQQQQQQIYQLSSLEGPFTDGTGTAAVDRSTLTSYAATVDRTRELEKKLLLVKQQNEALALQQNSAGSAAKEVGIETLAPPRPVAVAAISLETNYAPIPTNDGEKPAAGYAQSDDLIGFFGESLFDEKSTESWMSPLTPSDAEIKSRRVPCSALPPEDPRRNKRRLVIPGPDLPLRQSSAEVGSQSDPTLYADNINRTKIDALDRVIHSMPREETVEVLDARNLAPGLADSDEHKMTFLWHDHLMERAAASRMARYWKKRYELFGRDVALRHNILLNDIAGTMPLLRQGLFRSMPGTDRRGRAIQYFCPEILATHADQYEIGKAIWYVCNLAMDHHPGPSKQPGVVVLGDMRNFHFSKLAACYRMFSYLKSLRKCQPYDTHALHLFFPSDVPWWQRIVPEIMKNFVLPLIGRDHVVIHTGTQEKEVLNLMEFGILPDQIPIELGGNVSLDDWRVFLKKRLELGGNFSLSDWRMLLEKRREEGRSEHGSVVGSEINSFESRPGNSCMGVMEPGRSVEAVRSSTQMRLQKRKGQKRMDSDEHKIIQKAKQGRRSSNESVMSSEQGRSAYGTKQEARAKPGRKGDSRMSKAMEEKLKNPDITLLEALEKGGFEFDHQFHKAGMNDSKIFGADNVSLRQRKNQLNRRLKKAAKK